MVYAEKVFKKEVITFFLEVNFTPECVSNFPDSKVIEIIEGNGSVNLGFFFFANFATVPCF